jgi:hypothetical protein
MKRGLLPAIALLAWVTPARAEGDAKPFEIGAKPAWYVLAGVTTGGTLVARDRGGYVGGEASVVRLAHGGRFLGFYGDGYHDLGADRTYGTAGLELGYKFVGVDSGAAARFGANRPEWGITGRVFVGIGLLSLYGRYAYFLDSLGEHNQHVVQIGALVKLPIHVWGLE